MAKTKKKSEFAKLPKEDKTILIIGYTLLGLFCIAIIAPMIYIIPPLFINAGGAGLTGVWASMTISDMLGAVLAFLLMLTQRHVFKPSNS